VASFEKKKRGLCGGKMKPFLKEKHHISIAGSERSWGETQMGSQKTYGGPTLGTLGQEKGENSSWNRRSIPRCRGGKKGERGKRRRRIGL